MFWVSLCSLFVMDMDQSVCPPCRYSVFAGTLARELHEERSKQRCETVGQFVVITISDLDSKFQVYVSHQLAQLKPK